MYQTVLVPMALDHDVSPQTLAIARSLKADGGTILALHVYETPQGSVSAYLDADAVNEAYRTAQHTLTQKTAGLEDVRAEMVKGHSYRSIISYARDHNVDCIVIGSHKPGLSDYLLGSTAARVVRHAPCAVHVHRSK